MCAEGAAKGWHERNGGNLSYRIDKSDIKDVRESLNENGSWCELGLCVPDLAGEYFMVTGTGKYFKNVAKDPENNIGIVRLNKTGDKYKVVWGLKDGSKPTSELSSHIMNLSVCKKRDEDIRVVYHCHPANLTALTFVLPLDEEIFTRELWEMISECPMFLPDVIGIVPWMTPGGKEIADATAGIMKTRDAAVWAHHGLFVCGKDFDSAFGLAETIEKASEILVKVLSMSDRKRQTISPDNLRSLNDSLGIHLDERFLYEKNSQIIGEK